MLFKRKPFLLVVSAPSGCGKTTLLHLLLERMDGLGVTVSHTTRPQRIGESTGTDYYFIDSDQFMVMESNDKFIESATVHGNSYGTSFAEIEKLLGRGFDVVLDIDIQGMRLLKSKDMFDLVTVFILPPSIDELENRLRGRNTDSDQVISKRIINAETELQTASEYDYLVINDDVSVAVENLAAIVKAERLRSCRIDLKV